MNEDKSIRDTITVSMNNSEHFSENKEFFTQNDKPLRYFFKKVGEKNIYYKYKDLVEDEKGTLVVTYTQVKPLGLRNNFLEFRFDEYNFDSVITEADYAAVNERADYRFIPMDESQSYDANMHEMMEHPYGVEPDYSNAPSLAPISEQSEYFIDNNNPQRSFNEITEDMIPAAAYNEDNIAKQVIANIQGFKGGAYKMSAEDRASLEASEEAPRFERPVNIGEAEIDYSTMPEISEEMKEQLLGEVGRENVKEAINKCK